MDRVIATFATAVVSGSGYQLASTLSPLGPADSKSSLSEVVASTTQRDVRHDIKHAIDQSPARSRLANDEVNGWISVYAAYWKSIGEILSVNEGVRGASWTKVYESWKELVLMLHRGYTNHGFEAWTIPCLYMAGKHLRLFAIRSDEERASASTDVAAQSFQDDLDPEVEQHQTLRDCEQQLKRLFTLCISDRAVLDESRKWGLYVMANLLFKTYFKLNSVAMSRSILTSIGALKTDKPPFESFPRSQRVTFKYYQGVLAFLEEHYSEAEQCLTEAWQLCHRDAVQNKERILMYLIPCRLLTNHALPSAQLLAPYPRLTRLFGPLAKAIRRGNLTDFDAALQAEEEELVRWRIYLTLERGRDIAMRNLLRKVYIVRGLIGPQPGDSTALRSRVPIAEFKAAITMASGGEAIDPDEVECILANMIYKGHMKGYIAREHGLVVLSKSGAFPGTGV